MGNIKLYYIIHRINKTKDFSATYDGCLEYFMQQDKIYRKLHKIISEKEYNHIIKKKLTL